MVTITGSFKGSSSSSKTAAKMTKKKSFLGGLFASLSSSPSSSPSSSRKDKGKSKVEKPKEGKTGYHARTTRSAYVHFVRQVSCQGEKRGKKSQENIYW